MIALTWLFRKSTWWCMPNMKGETKIPHQIIDDCWYRSVHLWTCPWNLKISLLQQRHSFHCWVLGERNVHSLSLLNWICFNFHDLYNWSSEDQTLPVVQGAWSCVIHARFHRFNFPSSGLKMESGYKTMAGRKSTAPDYFLFQSQPPMKPHRKAKIGPSDQSQHQTMGQ